MFHLQVCDICGDSKVAGLEGSSTFTSMFSISAPFLRPSAGLVTLRVQMKHVQVMGSVCNRSTFSK